MATCIGRSLGSCASILNRTRIVSKQINSSLGLLGDISNIVTNSLSITATYSSESRQNPSFRGAQSLFKDVSGSLSLAKTGNKIFNLCLGTSFFEINEDGSFARDPISGRLKMRPTLLIASDISRLASNTLDSAVFGGERRLWDLGHHAGTLGKAASIASMTSSALSVLNSCVQLRDVVKSKIGGGSAQQRAQVRSLTLDLIRDSLDLAATPLESQLVNAGTVGLTVGRSLSMLGSVIGIVSVIVND